MADGYEAAVQAGAEALRKITHEWESQGGLLPYDDGARAVIDAATENVECWKCQGYGGVGHDAEGAPNPEPCPTCHGSGSIEVELMVGERVGVGRDNGNYWLFDSHRHEPDDGEVAVYRKVSLRGAT